MKVAPHRRATGPRGAAQRTERHQGAGRCWSCPWPRACSQAGTGSTPCVQRGSQGMPSRRCIRLRLQRGLATEKLAEHIQRRSVRSGSTTAREKKTITCPSPVIPSLPFGF